MLKEITWLGISSDYGNLIKWVWVEFYKVYNDQLAVAETNFEKYFKVEWADWARVTIKDVSWSEALKLVWEGENLPNLSTFLGSETTFIFKKYGWIITVTKEAIMDTNYKSELNRMKMVAVQWKMAKQIHASELLKRWFTLTEDPSYPLNRPNTNEKLFSIAHALANGDTYSNVLSNSAVLSPDSVAKMKRIMREMKTDNGLPYQTSWMYALIVPPALEDLANTIVKSDLKQGTPNNDINTNKWIEVIVDPYLGASFGWSDTAYYLVDKQFANLYVYNRQELEMNDQIDFKTKNLEFSIDWRWAVWFTSARWIVGSKWDGSTITD